MSSGSILYQTNIQGGWRGGHLFFLISINCLENSYYVVTYKKPALVGKLARLMMPALKLRGSEATSLFAFGLVCFISTVEIQKLASLQFEA